MNNKGFILAECIIIFFVISFLVLINLSIVRNMNNKDFYLKEKDLLQTKINSAKQLAIYNRENVYLKFKDNYLIIQKSDYLDKYVFKLINFSQSKELYFNAKGIINHGYTINFKFGFEHYKIIFYIGKGWFKIE